jgi:hypothetical protein
MQNSGLFKRLVVFFERYKQDERVILAMVVLSILIMAPVYAHRIYAGASDFPSHIQYAKLILVGLSQQVPIHILAHPGYQLLLAGIYWLAFKKAGLYAIAVLVQVVVQTLTVLVIYWWFGKGRPNGNWLRALWAVSLTLVAPLMVFVFLDRLFYLGYIGLATYHNPTIRLLQPVALLSFFLRRAGFHASFQLVEGCPFVSITGHPFGADQAQLPGLHPACFRIDGLDPPGLEKASRLAFIDSGLPGAGCPDPGGSVLADLLLAGERYQFHTVQSVGRDERVFGLPAAQVFPVDLVPTGCATLQLPAGGPG